LAAHATLNRCMIASRAKPESVSVHSYDGSVGVTSSTSGPPA
jgi:hypothetical protein